MINPITLRISDDSGFLAIVDASKYNSFVSEDWEISQLFNRFVEEMNNSNLIMWSTGAENVWTINFVKESTGKESFREFTKTIEVTDGQLFLTNYEDLTMAAEYEDEKVPADHNKDLYLKLDNGWYDITVRQFIDPGNYEQEAGEVDIEIIVRTSAKIDNEQIDAVFWWSF